MILGLSQDISIFKLKENIINASEVTRARRELSNKDIIYGGSQSSECCVTAGLKP